MFDIDEKRKNMQSGRPTKCPDLQTLNILYLNHSANEIAKEFGVSKRTVQGWFYRARKQVRAQQEKGLTAQTMR